MVEQTLSVEKEKDGFEFALTTLKSFFTVEKLTLVKRSWFKRMRYMKRICLIPEKKETRFAWKDGIDVALLTLIGKFNE